MIDTSAIASASGQETGPTTGSESTTGAPTTTAPTTTDSGSQSPDHPGLVGCVDREAPTFTHHVADLDAVTGVYPTIVTSGNWRKPNSYLWTNQDTPVYAPADATSVGLAQWNQSYTTESGSPQERIQFTVELQISCAIRVTLGHLEELAEPFASLGPSEAATLTTLDAFVYLPMEVTAGTLVGYARYRNLSGAADGFDIVMYNSERSNQFANQERYLTQGDLQVLLHADCPFDYYSTSMRSEWVAKFGIDGISVDGYDCDMAPDPVGTIAGGWFQSPHDPANAKSMIDWGLAIRIGPDGRLNIGHPDGEIRIDPTDPTFRNPRSVSSTHCFFDSSDNQFGYLKPIGEMEMTAAFGNGTCPSEMPSDFQSFYR